MKEEKKNPKIETLELYLLMIGNPKRAFTLIKDEYLKYSYASKILFAVSWWMILVYHQFMPGFLRELFYSVPVKIFNHADKYEIYLNNFRVFALSALILPLTFLFILYGVLKFFKIKIKLKQLSTSIFFIYSFSLIGYLITVIAGQFAGAVGYFRALALFEIYAAVLIVLAVHYLTATALFKSFLFVMAAALLNALLYINILKFLY